MRFSKKLDSFKSFLNHFKNRKNVLFKKANHFFAKKQNIRKYMKLKKNQMKATTGLY